jgi:uncharacterized cupin superfamily protein
MSEQPPKAARPVLVRAAERTRANEQGPQRHPLNPSSEVYGHLLGDAVGLRRLGVHLLRVPPGKESFVYHSHRLEEEWMFVLSGRGVMEVDGAEHEVGPGDFVGFPTPSLAHHLRNPFGEDLVYLSCGERREAEVADFPRHGKQLVRVGSEVRVYPLAASERWALE